MDSGVGRNMAATTNNARSRDFNGGVSLNGSENDRSSHATLTQGFGNTPGWGGSIWNNSLGSGFGSTVRDRSRPRENGAYMGASSGPIEGKTGSGSLVASSESDSWNLNRSPWGDSTTTARPHVRSSGVSPARKRSIAQAQPSQQFADSSTSAYFPVSRGTALSQGPVAKPTKTMLDPTSGNFTSTRYVESLSNGLASFGFAPADTDPQRSEVSVGPWSDAASLHSPSDDRRSVAASEYFGPSSTASRSGSLPPSRHGEPAQYAQNTDPYSRYTQANPRQHSSFSHTNGRPFQERSGSIQSESLQLHGRLSLNQDPDPALLSHRPSMSINGNPPAFSPAGADGGYSRDNLADAQFLIRADDTSYGNTGTYTPENFTLGHMNDASAQLRSFQFDSRSAPNGTATRPSPFYSHAPTPPGVYDHLYPSRHDQTLSNGNNFALVQSKLQGYQQQQQERRTYVHPGHFQPHNLQHVIAANNLRNPYNYPFAVPNGVHVNGLNPNVPIQVIPGMPGVVTMIEAPKGPREHTESVMSKPLYDFKQNSKTNHRCELKSIYQYVVEFSGDQHGSRFIQQKLESANSDEKDRVFRELEQDSLQLMQDVFGNYVIQKFFEHGDQTQKRILANRMKGNVVKLSLQMYGCRVVQKALEHVLTDQQALLVKELEKDVLHCVRDQNGNHVIQKAIERVPAEHIQFIIEAFKGNVGNLSVHSYGCRVIQRMLEHCEEPAKRFIVQELHSEGTKLFADQYGNYVTQHVIEHGTPQDRAKIITLVKNELLNFSKHKFASNVVEQCLVFGTDQQRREIVQKITEKNERGESNLLTLIKDPYGNYVIQKVLDMLSRTDYDELVAILKPEMEKAKKNISGKQMIAVEKKMHRFDRVDSVSSPPAQRSSMSSAADSLAEVPPLVSDAQSPQSSGLPSANASTVEDPVHTTSTADKTLPTPGLVSIANAS